MIRKTIFFFSVFTSFLIFTSENAQAQNQKVDSVMTLLASCKDGTTLDTAKFEQALNIINRISLTDETIANIEKNADKLVKGKDKDLSFRVRLSIFYSLSSSDLPKSIVYAKEQVKTIRESNTPHKDAILSSFLGQLRLPYRNSNQALAGLNYYKDQLTLFKAANDSLGMCVCYYVLSGFYNTTGLMDQSIYNMKKSLVYMDTTRVSDGFMHSGFMRDKRRWYNNNLVIGYFYTVKGEYAEGLTYLKRTFAYAESRDSSFLASSARYIAWNMALTGRLDNIDYYLKIAKTGDDPASVATIYQIETLAKIQQDSLLVAESLMQQCWELVNRKNVPVEPYAGTVHPDYYLALIRVKQGRLDVAIALLEKDIKRLGGVRSMVLEDYLLQANLYFKTKQYQQSADTYKSYIALNDSLLADQNKFRTASFEIEQEINGKELAISKLESKNKVSTLTRNYTIGLAVLFILLAAGIYFRFRSKQKANKVLEQTLSELKSTQSQLIQSEKMASLGELTAGIAHEIQNPLNFVTNFSEVSNELIDEMNDEIEKGDLGEAKAIADDIKQNLEKINHHGKRADAIVKGMLQHSRTNAGAKEPTDINALADEYLRLSYHGLRAKDKSFNADYKTDFDESLGKIDVVPQDIGRVFLNLFNNAFYACGERTRSAVNEKKSALGKDLPGFENRTGLHAYEPRITVSIKRVGDHIEIRVTDNGKGIPQNIVDKIFQPFFTTKPTGQGTGLGLSLSYDIVKAHGGELKLETKEGEGTTFIISIPA